jgi:tripeptidyl-peptidase I
LQAYQNASVQRYLQAAPSLPDAKLYTPTGRAIPDVSALGTCYTIFSGGAMSGTLSGTSASTPTFAGMVSLLNAEAAAQGKPPMGFINPALYQAADLGFDVTQGNNKLGGCPAGFPATEGWDAVTGLGTPTYQKLRAALYKD